MAVPPPLQVLIALVAFAPQRAAAYSYFSAPWNLTSNGGTERHFSWSLPALAADSSGLGGGITYAIDPSFCTMMLARFREQSFTWWEAILNMGFTFVDCAEISDAIGRAFNTWAANHKAISFKDVSSVCAAGGWASNDCTLAEVSVTATVPRDAEEAGRAAWVLNYPAKDRGWVSPPGPGRRTTAGVWVSGDYSIAYAEMEFNSAQCWYLDNTFCSGLHLNGANGDLALRITLLVCFIVGCAMVIWFLLAWFDSAIHQLYAGAATTRRTIVGGWQNFDKPLDLDLDLDRPGPRRGSRRDGGCCGCCGCSGCSGCVGSTARVFAVAGSTLLDKFERLSGALGVASTTLCLLLLIAPPIVYVRVYLPCVECFDFEAATAHEIGHILGFHHPDTQGYAIYEPAVRPMGPALCQQPLSSLERRVGYAGFFGAAGGDLDGSIMFSTTTHRARACLTQDDLDGLNYLYPACDHVRLAPPLCVRSPRRSGFLRLLLALLVPFVLAMLIIQLFALYASRRERKRFRELARDLQLLWRDGGALKALGAFDASKLGYQRGTAVAAGGKGGKGGGAYARVPTTDAALHEFALHLRHASAAAEAERLKALRRARWQRAAAAAIEAHHGGAGAGGIGAGSGAGAAAGCKPKAPKAKPGTAPHLPGTAPHLPGMARHVAEEVKPKEKRSRKGGLVLSVFPTAGAPDSAAAASAAAAWDAAASDAAASDDLRDLFQLFEIVPLVALVRSGKLVSGLREPLAQLSREVREVHGELHAATERQMQRQEQTAREGAAAAAAEAAAEASRGGIFRAARCVWAVWWRWLTCLLGLASRPARPPLNTGGGKVGTRHDLYRRLSTQLPICVDALVDSDEAQVRDVGAVLTALEALETEALERAWREGHPVGLPTRRRPFMWLVLAAALGLASTPYLITAMVVTIVLAAGYMLVCDAHALLRRVPASPPPSPLADGRDEMSTVQAASAIMAAPSSKKPWTAAEIEDIRNDCVANDVPYDLASFASLSEAELVTYFESGGDVLPIGVSKPRPVRRSRTLRGSRLSMAAAGEEKGGKEDERDASAEAGAEAAATGEAAAAATQQQPLSEFFGWLSSLSPLTDSTGTRIKAAESPAGTADPAAGGLGALLDGLAAGAPDAPATAPATLAPPAAAPSAVLAVPAVAAGPAILPAGAQRVAALTAADAPAARTAPARPALRSRPPGGRVSQDSTGMRGLQFAKLLADGHEARAAFLRWVVEVTAHVAEPDASLMANESDVTAVDAASDADIATAGMAAVRAVASVLRAVHEQQTAEAEAKREAAEAARSRGGNGLGSLFQRALPRARRGGANALRR